MSDIDIKFKGKTYRGSATVWRDVDTGQRPSAEVESRLNELEWLGRQKERLEPGTGPLVIVEPEEKKYGFAAKFLTYVIVIFALVGFISIFAKLS